MSIDGTGLIPRQPAENFCVGLDDGRPVANYCSVRPQKSLYLIISIVPLGAFK
ncbi:MAG: hypothetical protein FWH21_03675 [Kiritimatiellaeota bacterium]|nr:hypothetical protein [Kiritimatiellota bacterium]